MLAQTVLSVRMSSYLMRMHVISAACQCLRIKYDALALQDDALALFSNG